MIQERDKLQWHISKKRHDVTRFARSDPEQLQGALTPKSRTAPQPASVARREHAWAPIGREHHNELQTLVLSASGSRWGRNENCNPISVQRWIENSSLQHHRIILLKRFSARHWGYHLCGRFNASLKSQSRRAFTPAPCKVQEPGEFRKLFLPLKGGEEKKMTKQELMTKLESELATLRQEGEYSVKDFQVFDFPRDVEFGSALVRRERRTWSWGSCRSETCAHNSHDPYMSGDTLFLLCSEKLCESSNGW